MSRVRVPEGALKGLTLQIPEAAGLGFSLYIRKFLSERTYTYLPKGGNYYETPSTICRYPYCILPYDHTFFTSVEAVVYWTPGYFEKEYTKYQVLDDLPSMTMDDLLDVTDQMMAYLKGKRADLHVSTHMGGETREFFNEREIATWKMYRDCF